MGQYINFLPSVYSSGAVYGVDFLFQNLTNVDNNFNFTIHPGATRNFDVTIIDDSRAEWSFRYLSDDNINYGLYINDSLELVYCEGDYISIDDDDGRLGPVVIETWNYEHNVLVML